MKTVTTHLSTNCTGYSLSEEGSSLQYVNHFLVFFTPIPRFMNVDFLIVLLCGHPLDVGL